jgi:hypothetical protein
VNDTIAAATAATTQTAGVFERANTPAPAVV